MKTRIGFVSNSSSASFVIAREHVTDTQIHAIKMHRFKAGSDAWSIRVTDEQISGWTGMDNFGMKDYLILLGIPEEHINFGSDNDGEALADSATSLSELLAQLDKKEE